MKLVITERESRALRERLASNPRLLTSRISVVEVGRAVRRQNEREAAEQTAATLAGIEIVELDRPIAEIAAQLEPASLRSLDAVHLATALALGDELHALVTYDARLADAARSTGLRVSAPS